MMTEIKHDMLLLQEIVCTTHSATEDWKVNNHAAILPSHEIKQVIPTLPTYTGGKQLLQEVNILCGR